MNYTIILFLVLFHVTYITNFVSYNWDNDSNNTHFIDLSDQCINNTEENIFLPLGVGAADGVSILVSQTAIDVLPNCSILFNIARDHPSHLQIIVIEYIDSHYTFKEVIQACLGKNLMGYLSIKEVEPDGEQFYICSKFQPGKYGIPVFVHTGFAKIIQLDISPSEVFHSMKITFTSGRALGRHEYCNLTYEIQCTIGRETICINKALSCDRNINCGVFDENDEDYKICRVSRFAYLWIVVLAGLVTLLLVFIIFVYLLKTYIAEITDNFFIFNEDEDNKLVIRSQLNSHQWQNIKRTIRDPPCFCQETSDTNATVNSD
ncbi:uncharacterized protein LOC123688988 [Harmonia axyridis]|uniref:uncharacterized protein LOC123688988 n=1 Tax=Harmonia axyridis TaxID=115357 RepID=UPI001E2756C1|nr:uncharacterized protein LOC123688988 [Harmonia axyridis]